MGHRHEIKINVYNVSEEEARDVLERASDAACVSHIPQWFPGWFWRLFHRCRVEWFGSMNGPIAYCDECGEDAPDHDDECPVRGVAHE